MDDENGDLSHLKISTIFNGLFCGSKEKNVWFWTFLYILNIVDDLDPGSKKNYYIEKLDQCEHLQDRILSKFCQVETNVIVICVQKTHVDKWGLHLLQTVVVLCFLAI
jgi:hypothetical protein